MGRYGIGLVLLFVFLGPLWAEKEDTPPPSPNKVEGLELPQDQQARPGDGFVTLEAKADGPVRWLVVCQEPVRFLELDHSVVVSVPTVPTTVQVYAVGLVGNKLTAFARTVITVQGARPPPGPGPRPGPSPSPVAGGARLHVSMIVDGQTQIPAQAALVNSQTLRKALVEGNCVPRVYDVTSPVLKSRKLDTFVQKAGGAPALIVQDDSGVVRLAASLPGDEAGILAAVASVRK